MDSYICGVKVNKENKMAKKKQTKIERLVDQLDKEINRIHGKYNQWHREFDKYRGKSLSANEVDTVNDILRGIQETFTEMYPAYYFIAFRNAHSTTAVNGHHDFIENMKKAGAIYTEANEPAA